VNDSLFLPHRQSRAGIRALAGWESCWMPLGEGEAEGLHGGRSGRWSHVEVPAQQAAIEERSAIWYRTHFPRPDHAGRVLLRFGGAFLAANVWLNGRLLGSHYGYFAPFGFDLTPYLKPENTLVVCCESPVETDLAAKRHLLGWFGDGDARPYPAGAFFSLPEPYRWEVPVGLWRPVELEYVDSVIVDWLRLRPRLDADVGRLEVTAHLRNLDGREMVGELAVTVAGEGGAPIRIRREFRIGGGLEQTLAMAVSVPGARRWSPWRFGAPESYTVEAAVTVGGRESAVVRDRFGFRDVDLRAAHDGWQVRVNGRPMFLRGACYMPGFRLDQLGPERFRDDLRLAREANLDALRVHAHVLPEEFYREADAAGMLVLADLPLTLAYAYHASAEDARFFEAAVRAQVAEMAAMLGNRPSVAAWVAHDDPPWTSSGADLADVHAVRQNHTVDHEAKALFEELDPTRVALAGSGDTDSHLFLGWRSGGWEQLGEAEPRLVSEYGAQALPPAGSPVWEELGRRWPVADADPAWLHAGFQPGAWAGAGVGLPSDFSSLEEYAEAAEDYQAFVVGYATDQFRRRKFEQCWGAFVYHLVDAFPGIGFGMLDAARQPRRAYSALREAMAPLRLIADPAGFTPLRPAGFGYQPGQPVLVRLVVVNDDPGVSGAARVRWWVGRRRAPERSGLTVLRDAVRRKSYSGEVAVALPTAFEPALQATALSLPLDAEGDYRLEAELAAGGRVLAEAVLDFTVAVELEPARPRPLVPDYLAERLVAAGSLRVEDSVARFTLVNRTRPAVLAGLSGLRLDGVALAGARVTVETPSGRVPLARQVDLPLGRPLPVHVELDREAGEGSHELEFDIVVPGIASGLLRVTGSA
jgi:beta-mannosidase